MPTVYTDPFGLAANYTGMGGGGGGTGGMKGGGSPGSGWPWPPTEPDDPDSGIIARIEVWEFVHPDGTVTRHYYWYDWEFGFLNLIFCGPTYLGSITYDPNGTDGFLDLWSFERRLFITKGISEAMSLLEVGLHGVYIVAMIGIPGPEDVILAAFKLFLRAKGLFLAGKKIICSRTGRELTEEETKNVVKAFRAHYFKKVPQKARDVLDYIRKHKGTPPKDYKGGRPYENVPRHPDLPTDRKLLEYDVDPKVRGQKRNDERIVVTEELDIAWYTFDHYTTFIKMEPCGTANVGTSLTIP